MRKKNLLNQSLTLTVLWSARHLHTPSHTQLEPGPPTQELWGQRTHRHRSTAICLGTKNQHFTLKVHLWYLVWAFFFMKLVPYYLGPYRSKGRDKQSSTHCHIITNNTHHILTGAKSTHQDINSIGQIKLIRDQYSFGTANRWAMIRAIERK